MVDPCLGTMQLTRISKISYLLILPGVLKKYNFEMRYVYPAFCVGCSFFLHFLSYPVSMTTKVAVMTTKRAQLWQQYFSWYPVSDMICILGNMYMMLSNLI